MAVKQYKNNIKSNIYSDLHGIQQTCITLVLSYIYYNTKSIPFQTNNLMSVFIFWFELIAIFIKTWYLSLTYILIYPVYEELKSKDYD